MRDYCLVTTPAVVLPFMPKSVPILVPRGDGVPAVPLSVPPDYPTLSSSLMSSGLLLRRWLGGDAGDSSVPLSPNHVQAGHSQDVPEEGSLFHVSPVSLGFLTRPSRDAPPVTPEGVLLPSMIDAFSDSDLGAPMAYV